jgi:hypothetical protein
MNKKQRLKRIIDELKEMDPESLELNAAIQILDDKHQTMDEGEEEPPPGDDPGSNNPPKKPPVP